MASKLKVVMRCTTPVHDVAGVVQYQPGDLLPEGHPDAQGFAWSPTVVEVLDVPDPPKSPDPEPKPSSGAAVTKPKDGK